MATLTLNLTVTDAEVDRIVAAYQAAANTAVNGTATRNQVLQYVRQLVIRNLKSDVRTFEVGAAIAALPPISEVNPT